VGLHSPTYQHPKIPTATASEGSVEGGVVCCVGDSSVPTRSNELKLKDDVSKQAKVPCPPPARACPPAATFLQSPIAEVSRRPWESTPLA